MRSRRTWDCSNKAAEGSGRIEAVNLGLELLAVVPAQIAEVGHLMEQYDAHELRKQLKCWVEFDFLDTRLTMRIGERSP